MNFRSNYLLIQCIGNLSQGVSLYRLRVQNAWVVEVSTLRLRVSITSVLEVFSSELSVLSELAVVVLILRHRVSNKRTSEVFTSWKSV